MGSEQNVAARCMDKDSKFDKKAYSTSFWLAGQTIFKVKTTIDHNDVDQAGHLFGVIGSEIGKAWAAGDLNPPPVSPVFTFPSIAAQPLASHWRTQDPTLALWLQGVQLVVWSQQGLTNTQPCCPGCNKPAQSAGWDTTGRHCKGFGHVHTVYMVTRELRCNNKDCKLMPEGQSVRKFKETDEEVLKKLPSAIQALMPMHPTDNSGIHQDAQAFISALASRNVSMAAIYGSLNECLLLAQSRAAASYLQHVWPSGQRTVAAAMQGFLQAKEYTAFNRSKCEYSLQFAHPLRLPSIRQELHFGMKYQKSLCSWGISYDHGFKGCSDGTLTIRRIEGEVMAQLHGTRSLKEVADKLAIVGKRSEMLGQAIRLVYSDNARSDSNILRRVFPQLGDGFYKQPEGKPFLPNDPGVRQDEFHLYERLVDTFTSGHSMKRMAMEDLQKRFSMPHPDDVRNCQQHNIEITFSSQHIRRLLPPPHTQQRQLIDWANQWGVTSVDPDTGRHLFTLATLDLINRTLADIAVWMYSDPYMLTEHGWKPVNMYMKVDEKDGLPTYKSFRNTSGVEAFHSATNDVVQGNNAGPQLYSTLMQLKVCRYNFSNLAKVKKIDYGTFNFKLLNDENTLRLNRRLPLKYEHVPQVQHTKWQYVDLAEGWGYKWMLDRANGTAWDQPELPQSFAEDFNKAKRPTSVTDWQDKVTDVLSADKPQAATQSDYKAWREELTTVSDLPREWRAVRPELVTESVKLQCVTCDWACDKLQASVEVSLAHANKKNTATQMPSPAPPAGVYLSPAEVAAATTLTQMGSPTPAADITSLNMPVVAANLAEAFDAASPAVAVQPVETPPATVSPATVCGNSSTPAEVRRSSRKQSSKASTSKSSASPRVRRTSASLQPTTPASNQIEEGEGTVAVMQQSGSSRKYGGPKFANQELLPASPKACPVSTQAEKELFLKLYHQFVSPSGKGVNYSGMTEEWNRLFLAKNYNEHDVKQLSPDKRIYWKSYRYLARYGEQIQTTESRAQSAMMAHAVGVALSVPAVDTDIAGPSTQALPINTAATSQQAKRGLAALGFTIGNQQSKKPKTQLTGNQTATADKQARYCLACLIIDHKAIFKTNLLHACCPHKDKEPKSYRGSKKGISAKEWIQDNMRRFGSEDFKPRFTVVDRASWMTNEFVEKFAGRG